MIDWEQFYSQLRTPDFLPGYEIQNRLGGGAFGEVYKARKHSIGKVYAVKFLKITESAISKRELEQVSLFATIDHPNLVSVEDVGVVQDVPFVIMGYAGEDTLSRRIQRDELERSSKLRIFLQVCRGVKALHDRRLAHFDLKPSNVFLKGDMARVGDYGLSKLIADGKQTLSFGRGTPSYMAPEMLRNRADHRADIYSLGIILYELVAGKLPFDMDEEVIVREEDVPPVFPSDFPETLRRVVERATRYRAEDRYSTVQQLLDDMGQYADESSSVLAVSAGVSMSADGGGELIENMETLSESVEVETPVPDMLRRTASELARGAVGVAKGMWDGVRTRSSEALRRGSGRGGSSGGGTAGTPEDSAASLGDEVVSFQTIDDPDDADEALESSPPTDSSPVLGILKSERRRRELDSNSQSNFGSRASDASRAGSQVFSPWNALPAVGAASVGRTVPVPPAVDGGIIGSVAATLVLGFEVMVAIVSGPAFYVLRGVGRGVDRAFQPVPGFFGSSLKLVFFLALLAMLGGLIALFSIFLLLT